MDVSILIFSVYSQGNHFTVVKNNLWNEYPVNEAFRYILNAISITVFPLFNLLEAIFARGLISGGGELNRDWINKFSLYGRQLLGKG